VYLTRVFSVRVFYPEGNGLLNLAITDGDRWQNTAGCVTLSGRKDDAPVIMLDLAEGHD